MRKRLEQLETLVAARRPLGKSRPADFSDFAALFSVDVLEQLFTPAAACVLLPTPTLRANAELLRQRPGVQRALSQRCERLTGCPAEFEIRAAFHAAEAEVLGDSLHVICPPNQKRW